MSWLQVGWLQQAQDEFHKNVECFNCHKMGHVKKNCPNPRSELRKKAKVVCFYCGKSGHKRNKCPKMLKKAMRQQV